MNTALDQLRTLVENGTEEEVRAFIAQHLSEFPEDFQKEITVALFREALQEEIRERDAIIEIKQKVVEVIDAIEAREREGGSAQA